MTQDAHKLLLDIGNTCTKISYWSPESRTVFSQVETLPTIADSAENWADRLVHTAEKWQLAPADFSDILGCSVVPDLIPLINSASELAFGRSACFAPDTLPVPFDNISEIPDNVGPDRLVAAYGARHLLDAENIIICDFGTATTLDAVSGNRFLGGVICPGMRTSARALSSDTARLPELSLNLESPDFFFGYKTEDSLNQGFIFGFAALAEGLIERFEKELGTRAAVVATGGLAKRVADVCPKLRSIHATLTLEGLVFAQMTASRQS
ncbi:type III pantothenate kinase [Desulfobaculum bizertense]|uniref:Type III pantothenate kinase n=1 Tax=Desulfobaculum bizertense DSM 18034 TaxID=1121442 RepID=A0A1T4VIX8_9BACT|nr:type III pantothenate kinase [Desulfobaculum bizertense]UIJ37870.1 type III pantothenate kinase [Desulfobaculum bizertense]SKA64541.1 type III pantothenate kinase [Desulfobaculum bizertense DSM 18034]